MLLTNTINATAITETILAGNASVCAIESRDRSAASVQFADWQPAHRQAKRMQVRSMCASGYPDSGPMRPDSLPGCLGHLALRRSLRSVHGCVTVS